MKSLLAAILAGVTLSGCIAVPVYGPPGRAYRYAPPPPPFYYGHRGYR